ncbi:MAG: hypothetical protein H0W77_00015 [Acidobacteria bacterium]|nr:hypothetical protein [Acidobacteriota bacterium]
MSSAAPSDSCSLNVARRAADLHESEGVAADALKLAYSTAPIWKSLSLVGGVGCNDLLGFLRNYDF